MLKEWVSINREDELLPFCLLVTNWQIPYHQHIVVQSTTPLLAPQSLLPYQISPDQLPYPSEAERTRDSCSSENNHLATPTSMVNSKSASIVDTRTSSVLGMTTSYCDNDSNE